METNHVVLMLFILRLVVVDCSSYLVEEKDDFVPVSDSIGVKKVKDIGGDQINGSEGGNDIIDSISTPTPTRHRPRPPSTRKDGFQGEECDSSVRCMDKKKRFAACLLVPGNESPYLSLLIRNQGKRPLKIKISASAFVQRETDIKLLGKQARKVNVSIKNSGTESLIVLKDGIGGCSLNVRDLIVSNSEKSYETKHCKLLVANTFIFVAAVLIVASGWMCMSFGRRIITVSGLKYRSLEKELHVVSSGGVKMSQMLTRWMG